MGSHGVPQLVDLIPLSARASQMGASHREDLHWKFATRYAAHGT